MEAPIAIGVDEPLAELLCALDAAVQPLTAIDRPGRTHVIDEAPSIAAIAGIVEELVPRNGRQLGGASSKQHIFEERPLRGVDQLMDHATEVDHAEAKVLEGQDVVVLLLYMAFASNVHIDLHAVHMQI